MTRAGAVLVFVSGIALAFAFPEPDVAPVAWVALVPLIVAVPARGGLGRTAGGTRGGLGRTAGGTRGGLGRTAGGTRGGLGRTAGGIGGAASGLGLGLLFGVGFFGALLAWISLVGWVSWAALVVAQAAFVGLFGLGWAIAARARHRLMRVLAPPALWVTTEYLRSVWPFGGFPWGQLAQSQHDVPWLLGASAVGGGWLVAFVVVLVNAALAEALASRRAPRERAAPMVAVAAVALLGPALIPGPAESGRAIDVAIVQGGVPRGLDDDPVARELAITARHRDLTENLPGPAPDLVVWPESSVGLDLDRTPEVASDLRSAARSVRAPLLVGGNLDAQPDHYRVMAFLVAPSGEVRDRYQKTHLVPFGEYVPARRWLQWIPLLDQIPRDAVAGSEPTIFDVAGGRVAPVISFEGDFGSLVRGRIARGGRLLVVATNTSTWGRSWASAQHLAFSQVRAVENGVWVVHAALSGISAFVTPEGKIVRPTDLGHPATTTATVRFAEGISLYARTGDWLPSACVALSAAALLAGALGRRRSPSGGWA